MNNKWNTWLTPLGCLVVIVILLIIVFTSTGCSPSSSTGNSSTAQAYASESTSDTSKQIYVCSHLNPSELHANKRFPNYAAVIWVEPITQNVFSVSFAGSVARSISAAGDSYLYYRTISGPLQTADNTVGATPILFGQYQERAEEAGYTFIYEE